jgi:hypothetical protein
MRYKENVLERNVKEWKKDDWKFYLRIWRSFLIDLNCTQKAIFLKKFYSFIHMCIHCLGQFLKIEVDLFGVKEEKYKAVLQWRNRKR